MKLVSQDISKEDSRAVVRKLSTKEKDWVEKTKAYLLPDET